MEKQICGTFYSVIIPEFVLFVFTVTLTYIYIVVTNVIALNFQCCVCQIRIRDVLLSGVYEFFIGEILVYNLVGEKERDIKPII